MSVPGGSNPLLLATAAGAAGGYQIERSLRFNSADSAYLNRTPGSAGNRKTWTWAGWVKRGKLGSLQYFFACVPDTSNYFQFGFDANDKIRVHLIYIPGADSDNYTAAVFRDTSAWYHVVLSVDSTQATAANRMKLWVNGVEQTFSTDDRADITQNYDYIVNAAVQHSISSQQPYDSQGLFNGYLADIHFIDGQALDPSDFGEFDTNGVWQPIEYAGTFGTNGFHLPFSDNSTAAALGTDTSSNGNDWTVNNISVTAGAGNDSLVDSPTNGSQTDTGVGGEVVGNYATLNPVSGEASFSSLVSFTNGNLECSNAASTGNSSKMAAQATVGISSGKFYWEASSMVNSLPGVALDMNIGNTYVPTQTIIANYNGSWYVNGSATAPANGSSWTSSDVIGVALNMDNQELTFYKNGVSQGTFTNLALGTYFPSRYQDSSSSSSSSIFNFGQRPFAYTAPSGFNALCTTNLPEPTIADGSTAMDVVTYSGNSGDGLPTTQNITTGFSPDFVWIKSRSDTNSNILFDIIRGAGQRLFSNLTNAEDSQPASLVSFNSDGFTVGGRNEVNDIGVNYVAWTWDAGSSTVSNPDGSITSQVRANPSAGFSVVTYTGNGNDYPTGATVGHGLGVAPEWVIVKSRGTAGTNWAVWHSKLTAADYTVLLNDTGAQASGSDAFNRTLPTSTVFSVGQAGGGTRTNENGVSHVAYCFAPVAGYSSFGSYTGNGSADGPFVFTGMRPRWVLFKNTNSGENWRIMDAARNTYNVVNSILYPNLSNGEGGSAVGFDILSNGFKIRESGSELNASGATIVYAAFAEHPFATARAR